MEDDDEPEFEYSAIFAGSCTCDHEREEHGWGSCNVEDCECEAGWEE
jgi:hypothetical protein